MNADIPGHPAPPALASTVVLLRNSTDGLEVLLMRRPDSMKFFGGAHVFPGGRVEDSDAGDDAPARHRVAASRELLEEANVQIDPDALVPFARWITPVREARRFDAMFYVAALPAGQSARPDGHETTELRWVTPELALILARQDEIRLAPPTWMTLEALARFSSVDDAITGLSAEPVLARHPYIVEEPGGLVLMIPDESVTFTFSGGRWTQRPHAQ